MKNIFFLAITSISLMSCAVRVPYTNELRDEFSLDTDEKMSNVQFSTSHTIILDQEYISENQNTTENGMLISSSNSKKESLIIPSGTKCIFEGFGTKGEIKIRFEVGDEKYLTFSTKPDGNRNSKWYYFEADWLAKGGPKVQYGGNTFKIDMLRGFPRQVHLQVLKRNLQKNKHKQRVVKGLKV